MIKRLCQCGHAESIHTQYSDSPFGASTYCNGRQGRDECKCIRFRESPLAGVDTSELR
jgi:hypothetical protein